MKSITRLSNRNVKYVTTLGLVLLTLGLVAAGPALAATATASLGVTASIAASCTITTTALAFGAYDPIVTHATAPLDGTGTVSVTCTTGAATTITLGQGANADTGSSDAVPLRRMTVATNFLDYFLYQNEGRTTVWGNTEGTGVPHTGDGTATEITVYGQVPAAQNVPAGSYTDTVLATITF